MYKKLFKRFFDLAFSSLFMIVLFPLYIVLGILVVLSMGFPILFKQERIGKYEKSFFLYKFRSMTNAKDKEGNLLPEVARLTKVGNFLRSTSLDELPELWSIFIGKMSFVGPRPMPVYYGPYFYKEERIRHNVRGGLIPPDSLSLKVMTTYEEQFYYECYYAQHITFLLDVKVIFMTFIILYKRLENNYGSDFRPHLNVYRADKIGKKLEMN